MQVGGPTQQQTNPVTSTPTSGGVKREQTPVRSQFHQI